MNRLWESLRRLKIWLTGPGRDAPIAPAPGPHTEANGAQPGAGEVVPRRAAEAVANPCLGLRVVEEDWFLVIDFIRERAPAVPWTLFLFDDNWAEAATTSGSVGIPPDPEKLANYQYNIEKKEPSPATKLGVGLLPFFVANLLGDVTRLVVSDFVPDEASQQPIRELLRESLEQGAVACLLDLADSADNRRPPNILRPVYEMLRELRVPNSRLSLYSIGQFKPRYIPVQVERLIKVVVIETEGAELWQWWERLQGSIDYRYFEERTRGRTNWHNPSLIASALGTTAFREFIRALAAQDHYGVWQWIFDRLYDSAGLPRELASSSYDFLCGKAFLRKGASDRHLGKMPFYYTALRGLVHGLFLGRPFDQQVEVVERPMRIPRVEDVDNEKCMGKVGLEAADFETFSRALRRWVDELESDLKGDVRVVRAVLIHDAEDLAPPPSCALK
jgi:hypothetical protein